MKILATSEPTAAATPESLTEDMDAEIAQGKQFYLDGLIEQAYMDTSYTRTWMILDAPDVEAARAQFATYPQVRAGLIEFTFTPLIGMPAVAAAEEERERPLPGWWPSASDGDAG